MERETGSVEEGEEEEGVWLAMPSNQLHLHPTHGEFGCLKFLLIRWNWRDNGFVSG